MCVYVANEFNHITMLYYACTDWTEYNKQTLKYWYADHVQRIPMYV